MRKVRHLERSSSRLVIRPYRATDYAAWYAAFAQLPKPRNRWDAAPRPHRDLSRARFRELLKRNAERRSSDTFYDLGVFLRDGGALIGIVSIMDVVRARTQTAYVSYRIFNPYWGKSFAKEAMQACIDIGFRDVKLHRLEAGIEPDNSRSIHLARALGMRHEGCKRRCIHLRGKWVDLVMYTLTCEDVGLRFRGRLQPFVARI